MAPQLQDPEQFQTAEQISASAAERAERPISKKPGRVLVMVATYNEMENLPSLVEEILKFAPDCDLLVVDDNSPDGTGGWCDEAAIDEPRLDCLHREGKLGLGSAIIAGMNYAIDHDHEFLINLDADFSHPPRYLPDLLSGMEAEDGRPIDVMIGSRYVPGGGIDGWPLRRHMMSRGVNLYARTLLGLAPKDCSGGFRCYRTSVLAEIDLDAIRSRGYSFQEEILWLLKRSGATFGETPIRFVDRERGESKIDGGEALSALSIIFRLGLKNWLGV